MTRIVKINEDMLGNTTFAEIPNRINGVMRDAISESLKRIGKQEDMTILIALGEYQHHMKCGWFKRMIRKWLGLEMLSDYATCNLNIRIQKLEEKK